MTHGKHLAVDGEDLPDYVQHAALQAARDVREDEPWDDTWDETALAVAQAVWQLAVEDRSCACSSLVVCKGCAHHTFDLMLCALCRDWFCGSCRRGHAEFRSVNQPRA